MDACRHFGRGGGSDGRVPDWKSYRFWWVAEFRMGTGEVADGESGL